MVSAFCACVLFQIGFKWAQDNFFECNSSEEGSANVPLQPKFAHLNAELDLRGKACENVMPNTKTLPHTRLCSFSLAFCVYACVCRCVCVGVCVGVCVCRCSVQWRRICTCSWPYRGPDSLTPEEKLFPILRRRWTGVFSCCAEVFHHCQCINRDHGRQFKTRNFHNVDHEQKLECHGPSNLR